MARSRAIADALGILGYPGLVNLLTELERELVQFEPAVVLTAALACDFLEARVMEALPWLILRFPDLDWQWVIREARNRGTQNRLGFVVTLALRHGAAINLDQARLARLAGIEEEIFSLRADKEDAFCAEYLDDGQIKLLRRERPEEARLWNLLAELRPDDLPYGADLF